MFKPDIFPYILRGLKAQMGDNRCGSGLVFIGFDKKHSVQRMQLFFCIKKFYPHEKSFCYIQKTQEYCAKKSQERESNAFSKSINLAV